MTSFHEWYNMKYPTGPPEDKNEEENIEDLLDDVEIEEIREVAPEQQNQEPQQQQQVENQEVTFKPPATIPENTETNEKIQNLCRVCNSVGLININSPLTKFTLKVRITGDPALWFIPIGQIIGAVSGEEVSETDGLPQCICQYCLTYIQHAYDMRLRICANAANLRLARKLANEDSFRLEQQIDQTRQTRREVLAVEEKTVEEEQFRQTFKHSKIKINSGGPNNKVNRAIEHSCPNCRRRLMSIQSLNEHMEVCAISVFQTFYSEYERISKMRFDSTLTTPAFTLYAIKLVFSTYEKLKKIAAVEGIDVNSIAPDLPPINNAPQRIQASHFRRNQYSPDNGYASGGTPR